jgi:hypothetical protein
LYFSVPPFDNWQLLGAIAPNKPSGVFRTGWPTNEAMYGCEAVQLGVSIEPVETLDNLELFGSGVDDRRAFAHKIALDLYQFMASFSQGTQMGEVMTIPTNVLDRWMQRFEDRYRRDPNFMMKNHT